jgi:hypothetical protein
MRLVSLALAALAVPWRLVVKALILTNFLTALALSLRFS